MPKKRVMPQREVKVFRLGQLIEGHPTFSYSRLNRELINEFGSGIRKQDILALVRGLREVRLPAYKEPEETYNGRYQILRQNGFFSSEAKELARMKDIKPENRAVTFKSATWQSAIAAHKSYTAGLVKERASMVVAKAKALKTELSPQRILDIAKRDVDRILRAAIASKEYSPYDWMKVEYKPKPAPKGYQMEARNRAVDNLNRIIDKVGRRKVVQLWE